MISDPRCTRCFKKTYERLSKRFPLTEKQSCEFSRQFAAITEKDHCLSSPEIQRELYHSLCDMHKMQDPFTLEKMQSNMVAFELYKKWKPKVLAAKNPFDMALRLAIAGNIMDYGALEHFDAEKTLGEVLKGRLYRDDSIQLKEKIDSARRILFIGDNAGEIVFDKLLIEVMMHPNVTYAVRGGPIINDVTLTDAKETEMHVVADIISSGYDAPATILSKSGTGFVQQFDTSDLIISKGQGNLESLMDLKDPRIFFLLMVKCEVIAERVNAPVGAPLVFHL